MTSLVATPPTPDRGCRNQILWECGLSPTLHAEDFVARVLAAGARDVGPPGIPSLRMFEAPEGGHRLVFVPRTSRLQLRLDAMTPQGTRVDAARALHAWLVEVLTRGEA
ncbi:MAG: hypothetical protein RMA76_19935 [Deltaproteobacteria bacterium]